MFYNQVYLNIIWFSPTVSETLQTLQSLTKTLQQHINDLKNEINSQRRAVLQLSREKVQSYKQSTHNHSNTALMRRCCLCVSGARATSAEKAADGGQATSTGCSKRETHTGILHIQYVLFIIIESN